MLNEQSGHPTARLNPFDRMRPDQWITVIAVIWCLFWPLFFALKKFRKPLVITVAGLIFILSCLLFLQYRTTYADDQYMVTSTAALCYEKPGIIAKELNGLPEGSIISSTKLSSKKRYLLVESGGRTFWLRSKDLQKVWVTESS